MPPRCDLLRAPDAKGRSQAVIDYIMKTEKPVGSFTWVLLPDASHRDQFREKLALMLPVGEAHFQIETLLFKELNTKILELAGETQQDIDSPACKAILRLIVLCLWRKGCLKHFGRIAGKAGLIDQMLHFIDELKQNQVSPERFAKVASSQKDHEIALVYQHYQEFMRDNELVDRDGAGWLALAALKKQQDLLVKIEHFFVDGFDQFSPLQAGNIAAIAKQAKHTAITLPSLHGEMDGRAGDRVRRYQSAAMELERAFTGMNLNLEERNLSKWKPKASTQTSALWHLAGQLFRLSPQIIDVEPNIHFLEAPTHAQELREVLRRVKQLLLQDDSHPEEILIILTSIDEYLPHVAPIARELAIPVRVDIGQDLLSNPAVNALLRCLRLAEEDFSKTALLDVLQSRYIRPTGWSEDNLRCLQLAGGQRRRIASKQDWLEALEENPKDIPESDAERLLRQQTRSSLENFFEAMQPKTFGSWAEYLKWLSGLFFCQDRRSGYHIDLLASYGSEKERPSSTDPLYQRDERALRNFQRNLKQLSSLSDLIEDKDAPEGNSTEYFHRLLHFFAGIKMETSTPSSKANVRVVTPAESRGLTPAHTFILGLSEGLYPKPAREPPFYLLSERDLLRKQGIQLREDSESRQHEGIFYSLATAPRVSLTLTRPFIMRGQPWLASPYWQAAINCFSQEFVARNSTRLHPGAVTNLENTASLDEAFATIASHSSTAKMKSIGKSSPWLKTHTVRRELWEHFLQACNTEGRRRGSEAHDAYSGRLQDGESLSVLSELLDESYEWSASQLEDFASCGFRHFARYILKLSPYSELDEDDEAALYGLLTHEILQATYRRILHERLPIEATTHHYAQESLESAIDEAFQTKISGFFTAHLQSTPALVAPIKQFITRQLSALIQKDFSKESPFAEFGSEKRYIYALEKGFNERLYLANSQPGSFRLRGKIDRIDRIGDTFIIVDYKSGTHKIEYSDFENGISLQLPLYLLATRNGLKRQGVIPKLAAFNWHTRDRETSGKIDGQDEAICEKVLEHTTRILRRARSGDFSVQPTTIDQGRCIRYCPYFELCRLSRTNPFKPL